MKSVKDIINNKIIGGVKKAHNDDQAAIDAIVAKFPCPYKKPAGHAQEKTASTLQIELNDLNSKTAGITKEKMDAETGSITAAYNFADNNDPDGSKLKALAASEADAAHGKYDAARTKLANHVKAVADKTTEHTAQVPTPSLSPHQHQRHHRHAP